MTVVAWLRDWWGVPLLLALSCALLVVLNLAVIRDRYIVETHGAMHARYLIAGGHAVRAVAFLSAVLPLEWGDDDVRVLLLGGLVASYVLHLLGEMTIVSRRIFDRWYRPPWDGEERRSGQDRRRREGGPIDRRRDPIDREERKGERRGMASRPAPLDGLPPLRWPSSLGKFDDRPHHHD